ncbi:sigma 54-interacting transcriptional regulator [Chondromyces apiculatus]|uniref:Response regulator of zinc sigma-54-dependent two-component system n=1 Tax=Chondromyces apiculatus DSM 436 TaxID=1192034 RepID=A0A017T7T5_9BACT|nr:sigma 54-interacting transcriptional regulator [Chondromyces apiculatus]EYF05304.1 Response regulator of zinc sigma-54-dependent two-component system [Chondromyces apiculatus DSM 436]
MSALNDATRARAVQWFVRGGQLLVPGRDPLRIGVSPIVLGRDPSCGVVLDDREVSATHCELRAEGPGVLLRDLGSRNGTFVGGVRVREGILTAPCSIHVGGSVLGFEPLEKERVEVGFDEDFGPLVGSSPRMRHLFRLLREVAPTDLSILVTGETGTGKELVAQAVHEHSSRSAGPFVVLDCASIPGPLAESLLFGHERGAFTGATERRSGAFQDAHRGTIFLDELGELPPELQPKLLRVLAERKVKRVGSSAYEPVDVRVVAATRRDLGRSMNTGVFRSDLFFRIAQMRIELPPLRDRREDIPPLVQRVCERIGRPERTPDVVDLITSTLAQHDFPGNVRELVNVASVAASLPRGAEAVASVLPLEGGGEVAPALSAFSEAKRVAVGAFEQRYFSDLVRATDGNVSEMARRAGMERHHVRAFLKKYGLSAR